MRIEIEIPEEFEADYNVNRFSDFFSRVRACIDYNGMFGICGNYERETADVLIEAFKNSRVVQPVAYKCGRLIDADAYRDDFIQNVYDLLYDEPDNIKANLIIDAFDNITTVYNVDKVVEQLEEEEEYSKMDFESYAEDHGLDADDDWHYLGLKRAIEIVRSGGKE